MNTDILSFDVGLNSVERFDNSPEVQSFPKHKTLDIVGETPKVHLEDVFAIKDMDREILSSVRPQHINPAMDKPMGHLGGLRASLQWLEQMHHSALVAESQALVAAIELVKQNEQDLALVMSLRLILLRG